MMNEQLEPVSGKPEIVELLAQWELEGPLAAADQFPEISDLPSLALDDSP